ncbi:MAG: hypothetical protein RI897_3026 [Verrucomicrobiota bacterium]
MEEGFDDGAVFRVFGWVGFDGELADGADFFFGGYGDAEGGVGAEGFPVLGGAADIGVSQDHGEGFALEGAFQNALVLSGLAEGVAGLLRVGCGHGVGVWWKGWWAPSGKREALRAEG